MSDESVPAVKDASDIEATVPSVLEQSAGSTSITADVDVPDFEITPETGVADFPVRNYLTRPCVDYVDVTGRELVEFSDSEIAEAEPFATDEEIAAFPLISTILHVRVIGVDQARRYVPSDIPEEFFEATGGTTGEDYAFTGTEVTLDVIDTAKTGLDIPTQIRALLFLCWEPGSTSAVTIGEELLVFGELLAPGVGPVVSPSPTLRFYEWLSVTNDGTIVEGLTPFGSDTEMDVVINRDIDEVMERFRTLKLRHRLLIPKHDFHTDGVKRTLLLDARTCADGRAVPIRTTEARVPPTRSVSALLSDRARAISRQHVQLLEEWFRCEFRCRSEWFVRGTRQVMFRGGGGSPG